MIALEIFGAIGVMTVAYFVSEAAKSSCNRLAEENRHPFLVKVLAVVHFVAAALSFFVGLIMYFYLDEKETSYKNSAAEKISDLHQQHASELADLKAQNLHLQSQIKGPERQLPKNTYDQGLQDGYISGYAVGFEDCMDILEAPADQKPNLCRMARLSGIHRIKTRPSVFEGVAAINMGGILK